MREILDQPNPVKRLIPARIKRPVRKAILSYIFRRAMRDLSSLQPGEMPPRELLKKLRLGWDNQSWDAKLDYLEEIVRRALATEGPILECGSGLTTLVLGWVAGRKNVETWSLEHDVDWYQRVSDAIKAHRIPRVNLCFSPRRDYGEFNWYDAPLGKMPSKFSLVVCDGPPLVTGGRYGLLPIFGDRLESGTMILFDDARKPGQPEVLQRWALESGVQFELRETDEVSFALVTCP